MKKLLSISLVMCLIHGICTLNVLANDASDISGNILTENEAITVFEAGNINMYNSRSITSNAEAVIQINYSSIVNEDIVISGSVSVDNEDINFNLHGNLYKSVMQDKGIDAYCGDLKDEMSNFEVLHFFIKNDTDYYQYILDDTLRNKKIFLLYLRDSNGNVFTFEDELESLNLSSNSVIDSDHIADSSDDILWFGKIIPGEYIETEKTVPLSFQSGISYSPVISRNSVYYGQDWNENANGKVWTQIGDVPTAGTTTAQTALKLEESLYIDGVYQGTTTNFTINESSTTPMSVRFAFGYNTGVAYAFWTGNYYKVGSTQVNPDISLSFGTNIGVVNASYNISLPLTYSSQYYADEQFQVGGMAKNIGFTMPSSKKLYLKNDGDRIDVTAHIGTPNSALTGNYSTSARAVWDFQLIYIQDSPDYVKHTQTNLGPVVSYVSNVR